MACHPEQVKGFPQQVDSLVQAGAFSANNQWYYIGNHIGNSEVVITAQLICIQNQQDKAEKAAQEKNEQHQIRLERAQMSLRSSILVEMFP